MGISGKMMETPVFIGSSKAPGDDTVSEVYRRDDFLFGSCSDVHCQLWDRCLPFQIMFLSTDLTGGGLQLS